MVSRAAADVPQVASGSPDRFRARFGGTSSLRLPKNVTLEFARSLLEFMNATGSGASYRLVIEEDDMLLEHATRS